MNKAFYVCVLMSFYFFFSYCSDESVKDLGSLSKREWDLYLKDYEDGLKKKQAVLAEIGHKANIRLLYLLEQNNLKNKKQLKKNNSKNKKSQKRFKKNKKTSTFNFLPKLTLD